MFIYPATDLFRQFCLVITIGLCFIVEEGRRKRTAYEGPRPSDYDKLCKWYLNKNLFVLITLSFEIYYFWISIFVCYPLWSEWWQAVSQIPFSCSSVVFLCLHVARLASGGMFLSCPVVHPFVRSWVLRLVLLIQYFEWFWCKLAQVVYWARAWNGQLSGSRGERSRLYEVSERWTAVRGIIVDPLSQVGFLIYSVSVFLLHAFILFVCKVPDNFWGVGVQWTIYQFLYFNCNYCATTCFSEFLFPKTWNWLGCTITLCLSLRLLLLFFLMIFDDRLWLVGEVSTAARWYTLRQYPRLLRHLRAARNVSFLTGICVLIIKYLVTVLLDNDHKTTISDEQRYVRNYNVDYYICLVFCDYEVLVV